MSNQKFLMEARPSSCLRKGDHVPLSAVVLLLFAAASLYAVRAIASAELPLYRPGMSGNSSEPARLISQLSSQAIVSENPGGPRERQSAVRTFSPSTYGVSFQYPASASLKSGSAAEMSGGWLGGVEMDFAQPGGVWVASVELPADSYPKTDFSLAFFS